jgi:hypothetical protein
MLGTRTGSSGLSSPSEGPAGLENCLSTEKMQDRVTSTDVANAACRLTLFRLERDLRSSGILRNVDL